MHALLGQLKNQFSKKRGILADFMVLCLPQNKKSIVVRHTRNFFFLSASKRRTEFLNACSFEIHMMHIFSFSEETQKSYTAVSKKHCTESSA